MFLHALALGSQIPILRTTVVETVVVLACCVTAGLQIKLPCDLLTILVILHCLCPFSFILVAGKQKTNELVHYFSM